MTQLDKFTFVPQVFWLVVIFFLLYYIIVEYSLPRLFKILHFRKKKILNLNEGSTGFCKESFFFKNSSDNLMVNFINNIKLLPETLAKVLEIEVSTSTSSSVEVNAHLNKILSTSADYEVLKDQLDYHSIVKNNFKSNKKI